MPHRWQVFPWLPPGSHYFPCYVNYQCVTSFSNALVALTFALGVKRTGQGSSQPGPTPGHPRPADKPGPGQGRWALLSGRRPRLLCPLSTSPSHTGLIRVNKTALERNLGGGEHSMSLFIGWGRGPGGGQHLSERRKGFRVLQGLSAMRRGAGGEGAPQLLRGQGPPRVTGTQRGETAPEAAGAQSHIFSA